MSMLLLISLFFIACNSGESPYHKKSIPAKMQFKIGLENCKADLADPIQEMTTQLISKFENDGIYFQNFEQDTEKQELTLNIIGYMDDESKTIEDIRKALSQNVDLKFITASRISDSMLNPILDSIIIGENLTSLIYLDPAYLGYSGSSPTLAYFNKNDLNQVKAAIEKRAAGSPYNFYFGELKKSFSNNSEFDMALYASKKRDTNILTQESIMRSRAAPSQTNGMIEIYVEFDEEGAKQWATMTTNCANDNQRAILITLNGEVLSAPMVNGPILGGRSSISGNFSLEEATSISDLLNNGKKVCDVKILEERMLN